MFRSVFRLSPGAVLEAGTLKSLADRTSAFSSRCESSPLLRKEAPTAKVPRTPLRQHERNPPFLTSAPLERTPSTRGSVCLGTRFSVGSGRAILFQGSAAGLGYPLLSQFASRGREMTTYTRTSLELGFELALGTRSGSEFSLLAAGGMNNSVKSSFQSSRSRSFRWSGS